MRERIARDSRTRSSDLKPIKYILLELNCKKLLDGYGVATAPLREGCLPFSPLLRISCPARWNHGRLSPLLRRRRLPLLLCSSPLAEAITNDSCNAESNTHATV